jgi:hypothetical protein
MADWRHVRRIALALPETHERERGGHATWYVRDKAFAWERPLRPADLRALGDRAPSGSILAARVPHLLAKEARLAALPEVCFTTPHFDGFPAVLLRLGKVKVAQLQEVLVEAWLAQAPQRLARKYLDQTTA